MSCKLQQCGICLKGEIECVTSASEHKFVPTIDEGEEEREMRTAKFNVGDYIWNGDLMCETRKVVGVGPHSYKFASGGIAARDFIDRNFNLDPRPLPVSEPVVASTELLSAATTPAAGSSLDVQVGGNHYKKLVIQPVLYALVNKLPFVEGSVVKYVTRWRDKEGVKDLKKAKHFLEMLIDFHEGRIDLIKMTEQIQTVMESEK